MKVIVRRDACFHISRALTGFQRINLWNPVPGKRLRG